MIGTINRSNPVLIHRPGQRKSTLRRVTFSAETPTQASSRSRPLPSSSSPRSSSPRHPSSPSSSPRSGDGPLSDHLTVVSYGVGPGRSSGVSRSSLGSRENAARTLSAERRHSNVRRRTPSAGQRFPVASSSPFQGLPKSSSIQEPPTLQQYAIPPSSLPQQPLPGADLYIPSTNAIRQQHQQHVIMAEGYRRPHSSASVVLRNSSAMSASRPEPEPRRRLVVPRPQTTTLAQMKSRSNSRRLGAHLYPRFQRSDLERERAWFRSEVCLIADIMQAASRPQSMKWRAAGVSRQQQQQQQQQPSAFLDHEQDSFCQASVAEPFMNNAGLAKVFHVVPQRVVSARGGAGIPGASSALQRLNQSTCHRHTLLHRAMVADNSNNNTQQQYYIHPISAGTSNNKDTSVTTSPLNDEGDKKSRSNTSDADNNNDRSNIDSRDSNINTQIATRDRDDGHINADDDNNSAKNDTVTTSNNTATVNDMNDSKTTTRPGHGKSSNAATSGKGSAQAATGAQRPDGGGTSRGATAPGLDFPRDFLLSGLKGVDVLREHSTEWLEETRLKNQESVAILSEQLKSMITESDDQEEEGRMKTSLSLLPSATSAFVLYQRPEIDLKLIPAAGGQLVSSPPHLFHEKSSRQPLSLSKDLLRSREKSDNSGTAAVAEDATPRASQVSEGSEGERQDRDEGGERRPQGRSELCMKTMQCEVLGPYSCADCTKIRVHERHSQEQTSLYPGITADPRTLVAPDRIRKLTASLPPSLVSQRHTLDCGCSIKMHPDFLFPVIVTDHDVHSRLMTLKSAQSNTDGADRAVEFGDDATSTKRRRGGSVTGKSLRNGREYTDAGGSKMTGERFGDRFGDTPAPSPVDMKVTVRYNTPSPPDHNGIFLTNEL